MTGLAARDVYQLRRSRAYCETLTRTQARNFYYGLKLLPEPKRSAMFALYSYMRLVDDIADDEDGRTPEQRLADLDAWQTRTHAVLGGDLAAQATHPLWPALADMVRQYGVPTSIFDDAIAGQQQDLSDARFATFTELREYCIQVAGVVGLASIYIWGFEGGEATAQLALDRGIAFQLTNILRDLREDAQRGRVYLPEQELRESGVTEEDLRAGGPRFAAMMKAQIARARSYYEKSAELDRLISRDSRPTLQAMTDIYRRLLDKIAQDPQRVLCERVSLSVFSKLWIGWRAVRAG
ncbi:MAG TPA: phytoene/squalene synthase family protein [Humisphaera sp.]|jgi:phytoene synthase|nr:phytoene/squalene synthase family protein [Humisphaera sp.]